jgi:acylphosphatase
MLQNKSVELTLSGQVVGVGLRQWTQMTATQVGVAGWVRNNLDRTVTIHAEGPTETVDVFVERLRRPSLEAVRVDDVQVRDIEAHGYSGFSIEWN